MYVNVFDNFLLANKKLNSYLLYGDEPYMLESYTKKIIKHHNISTKDVNFIYFDDYDYEKLSSDIKQNSLFCETNFFVIKTDKKLESKQVKNIVLQANKNSHIVVVLSINTKERLSTYEKYFEAKNNSLFVRFFKPSFALAISLLQQKSDSIRLEFEFDALQALYLLHEQDLSLSINDLEKLSLLDKKIDSKIVYSLCFGVGHIELQEFVFDFFENKTDTKETIKIVQQIDEMMILWSLGSFVQELFMINCYTRINGIADAKDILGYQPPADIWNKKVSIASNLTQKRFLFFFNYFVDIELKLKTNKHIDKKAYLISMLLKIDDKILDAVS